MASNKKYSFLRQNFKYIWVSNIYSEWVYLSSCQGEIEELQLTRSKLAKGVSRISASAVSFTSVPNWSCAVEDQNRASRSVIWNCDRNELESNLPTCHTPSPETTVWSPNMTSKIIMLLLIVSILALTTSGFTPSSIPIWRNDRKVRRVPRRESCTLCLAPQDIRYVARPEVAMIKKVTKCKKTYNVPGYVKGKYDQIKAVFRTHSIDGKMTYQAFLDSRYLRFWPGKINR